MTNDGFSRQWEFNLGEPNSLISLAADSGSSGERRQQKAKDRQRRSRVHLPNPAGLFDASLITPIKPRLYKRLHTLSIS
jgi:hypothetical protein